MKMRRRHGGGDTHRTHFLALSHRAALCHGNVSQQAVLGLIAVTVVYGNLIPQALAGANHMGHLARCHRVHLGPLRSHQVQPFMLDGEVVHRVVLHADGSPHLHIRHIPEGQGEGRDAVGLFLEDAENVVKTGIDPGSQQHQAVRLLGGRFHVITLRQGIRVFLVGPITADIFQRGRRRVKERAVDGVVLLQQAVHHVSYEFRLGHHGPVHIAVQAVFFLEPLLLRGGEQQCKHHIQKDGGRYRSHRVAEEGHQNAPSLTGFFLRCHQFCGFLTMAA